VCVAEGTHIEIAKPHEREKAIYLLVRRHIINATWKPDVGDFKNAAERLHAGS